MSRAWLLFLSPFLVAQVGLAEHRETRVVSGIDVSRHSGDVDWQGVAAAGHSLAYLKATEGQDLVDSRFHENWKGAHAAGLARGAYHFYVTEDDPVEQAAFFLETVGHIAGDLAPVMDIELVGRGSKPGWQLHLRSFLEVIERDLGVKALIYTSPHFWDDEFGAALGETFSDHPLWVAEYGVDAPLVPAGFECWQLWQFEGDAQVPGVEKSADLSRMHPETELSRISLPDPSTPAASGRTPREPRRAPR